MGRNRQRAVALKAADAKLVINSSLPNVLTKLTPAQIDQVQRVFDAAVVNPVIQKEYADLRRKSITAQSGALVLRDDRIVRQADKKALELIPVSANDKVIRLDFQMLLTRDALTPRTDNPDEAAYLQRVRNTLIERGIWLRIGQPWVRNPDDPSSHVIDPRKFEVWLSVGYDGDTIPTKNGQVDREALLGTTIFGAGYWTNVHQGYAEKTLKREINRLLVEIDYGLAEHDRLIKRKRDAFPGVAEISDFVGGADLPSRTIWDHPRKLVHKAMEMNVGGNISGSQPYLVVAAIATRNAAQLLSDYADASSSGAGRVISVLRVLKTAGEVAEIGLSVTGVAAVVRGGARVVGTNAAKESIDEAAEKLVKEYVRKNPGIADDLDKVRWIPGPKGSVGGRGIKPGQRSGNGTGFNRWP